MRSLKADHNHLLGSDCHNLKDRKPDLGEAIALINRKLGKDAIMRIQAYEQDVLSGT